VLTLDKKQTWSVPNLESDTPEAQAYLANIASQIKDLRPLGMFRLSESEFLIAYTECAVYVNQQGEVSRSVIMEFVGRANTACLYGKFLILLNDDFVEVRNAMNGRLRQVIPGRNVVCLDDGGNAFDLGSSSPDAAHFSHHGADGNANGLPSASDLARAGRTVKICMQHPEYPRNQIVIELVENEGQKD
jgi:CNH domain